ANIPFFSRSAALALSVGLAGLPGFAAPPVEPRPCERPADLFNRNGLLLMLPVVGWGAYAAEAVASVPREIKREACLQTYPVQHDQYRRDLIAWQRAELAQHGDALIIRSV